MGLLIWPGVRVLCFSAVSFLAWNRHFINFCGSHRVGRQEGSVCSKE